MAVNSISINVPTPQPISLSSNQLDNVRYFKDQWKCYCFATGLDKSSEEMKMAILNIVIGQEACNYIKDRLVLTEEDRVSSDRILAALEQSFKPKVNYVYERYKFYQAAQDDNERIDSYVGRLKKLATNCDFRDRTEEHIRDRLILGIKYQRREDLIYDPDLTLQKAVDYCRRIEMNVRERELNNLYQKVTNPSRNLTNGMSIDVIEHIPTDVQIKIEKLDPPMNEYPTPNSSPALSLNSPSSSFNSLPPPPKAIKIENWAEKIGSPRENGEPLPPLPAASPIENQISTVRATVSPIENQKSSVPEKNSEPVKKPHVIHRPKPPDYEIGSFVVAKSDLSGQEEPAIWKIDNASLLQKFVPFKQDNVLLYKSTAVYCGWSISSQPLYEKVPVMIKNRNLNQKEFIVQLKQDLVKVPATRGRKRKE